MPVLPIDVTLKVADEPWEFDEIHRLNHRTFALEIPQHSPDPDGRLVDKFHAENTYVVALRGRELVGMVALRDRRPFSLDAKIANVDRFLPAGSTPIEVRLLAIVPEFRKTALFAALLERAVRIGVGLGADLAVISGTTRQTRLYRRLGFVPFGPLVGTPGAMYQPMYVTCEAFGQSLRASPALRGVFKDDDAGVRPLNLLPGPVHTTAEVDAALAAPAVSHRGAAFLAELERVRSSLCELTGARSVQVMPGSGTLANTVVAAQLGARGIAGLVVSNGEFGERLAAEARSARLRFDWLRLRWGEPFDPARIAAAAARVPRGGWLWCVHHETSTGMLQDLDAMKVIAARHDLRLVLDCISSIGAVPVDLRGVHMATASSGKGLGAYPGLAIVFHDHEPRPQPQRLPRYIDLGHWADHASAPHTHSSNLVGALGVAVRGADAERMRRIRECGEWLRATLRAAGFALVAPDDAACPALVTIALGRALDASSIGEELEARGFWLSFRSRHLAERNWIQVSLLGDPPRAGVERFVHAFLSVCSGATAAPTGR